MRRSRWKMILGICLTAVGGVVILTSMLSYRLNVSMLISGIVQIIAGIAFITASRRRVSSFLGSSSQTTGIRKNDDFNYEGQKLNEEELTVEQMTLDEAKGKKAYNTVNGIYIGTIVDEDDNNNWIIENSDGEKIENQKSSISIK